MVKKKNNNNSAFGTNLSVTHFYMWKASVRVINEDRDARNQEETYNLL